MFLWGKDVKKDLEGLKMKKLTKRYIFSMTKKQHREFKNLCEEEGYTMSKVVRLLIKDWMEIKLAEKILKNKKM